MKVNWNQSVQGAEKDTSLAITYEQFSWGFLVKPEIYLYLKNKIFLKIIYNDVCVVCLCGDACIQEQIT